MADLARLGDFRCICDHSGFMCWASETVIQWDGKRVLKRFADVRNPGDYPARPGEGPPPRDTRPEREDQYPARISPSAL